MSTNHDYTAWIRCETVIGRMDPILVYLMAEIMKSPEAGFIMTSPVLSRLHEIRESYVRRRTLFRELGAYTTAGDLDDIEAAIDRCDHGAQADPETQEIRRFLAVRRNNLSQMSSYAN